MKAKFGAFFSAILALTLSSCDQPVATPTPDALALPDDAIGYFCGMVVKNHDGPKGQIFIEGQSEPHWFTSVRDTLAYTRLPEETASISVIYVSDMGKADSWAQPGDNAWILGRDAYYVVGSSKMGGMGASEAVPFSSREVALNFAAQYGGNVMRLDDIPTDDLLGSDLEAEEMDHQTHEN